MARVEMLFVASQSMQSTVVVLCCVVLRCRSRRPEGACSPRPKTAMQAGCHLSVCETFCWSGLDSSPAKRMDGQRSSSSLAGLGGDLALNGSFVRVRDECRSPECSVEPVSRSRNVEGAESVQITRGQPHGSAWRGVSTVRAGPAPELSFPAEGAESAN